MARHVAGPRQPLFRIEHLHEGRGTGVRDHEIGHVLRAACLRHQIAPQVVRLSNSGRESDRRHLRREPPQSRKAERQQVAAFRCDQRVQFVEHDAFQRREQVRRVVGRQQQRELFRRGQQDVRRIFALALPPRHRRVAGAGFDPDRQLHIGDGAFKIAGDVHRQRLQRRDVERMQSAAAGYAAPGRRELCRGLRSGRAEFHQRRQKSGQRLARAGRRDQQRRAIGLRLRQQVELMRARRPAPRRKPAQENIGQQLR